MTYPNLDKALELFEDCVDHLRSIDSSFPFDHSDIHCIAVATNAMTLANRLPHLNPRKAYILGLLHDYGERLSRGHKELFHGTSGYDAMMELGYDDVARTCLTHSFPNPNFNPEDYVYPQACMIRAKKIISSLEYDDYDRLIQYSDLLVSDYKTTSVENRVRFIKNKYKISEVAMQRLNNETLALKNYFNDKCQCDTYELLEIKER